MKASGSVKKKREQDGQVRKGSRSGASALPRALSKGLTKGAGTRSVGRVRVSGLDPVKEQALVTDAVSAPKGTRKRVSGEAKATRAMKAVRDGETKGPDVHAPEETVIPAHQLTGSRVVEVESAVADAVRTAPVDGEDPEASLHGVEVIDDASFELPPRDKVRAEEEKVEETPAVVRPDRGPWDENTSLRLYLREAVETDLLTPDEEVRLANRIQAGDDAAREHMIKANLRLVVKIAREYEDFGLPLLDLINEGNIGLMRAVERFDPTKGAKLSTYAAWWIKQSIKRALSNQSKSIRLPIHVVQELARMKRAESRLESEIGRLPTDAELAAEMEVEVEDIQRWREAAAIGATSLDAPLGNEPDSSRVSDVISDENATMPWDGVSKETNAELVRELVETLNPREQKILKQRFALDGGDPRTLEDIGRDFGLTRERIRQLEAAALKKLRDRLRARDALHSPA